jgi:hypothetical protein
MAVGRWGGGGRDSRLGSRRSHSCPSRNDQVMRVSTSTPVMALDREVGMTLQLAGSDSGGEGEG